MNKAIISLLFLFNVAISKECPLEKTEPISYYFLNGVNVSEDDSVASADLIMLKFKIDPLIFNNLYNPTPYQGQLGKTLTPLWDSIKKSPDSVTNIVKFPLMVGIGIVHFSTMIGSTIIFDAALEVIPQKVIELNSIRITNKNPDVKISEYLQNSKTFSLVKSFLPKLDNNHANIIFAHSQGNLVANELCQNKNNKEIEIISIASPAGQLPCNTHGTYALYNADFVILPLMFAFPSFKYLHPNFTGVNHLLSGYLDDPLVLSSLKQGLSKTVESIYDNNVDFDLLSIKIETRDEIKPVPAINQKTIKESMSSKRRSIANEIVNQFGFSIFNQSFTMEKSKLSRKDKNTKDLNMLIDIPINVRSDEEYKDFLTLVKSKIKNICNHQSEFTLPKDFSPKICDYIGKGKDSNEMYQGISVSGLKQISNKEISLSCKDAKEGTRHIALNFLPDHIKDQHVNFNINGVNSQITIPAQSNPKISSKVITQIDISVKDNKEYVIDWSQVIDNTSDSNLASDGKKANRSIASQPDVSYQDCSTFRKLASPQCETYLDKLFQ